MRHVDPLAVRANDEASRVPQVGQAVLVLVDVSDRPAEPHGVEGALVLVLDELRVSREIEGLERSGPEAADDEVLLVRCDRDSVGLDSDVGQGRDAQADRVDHADRPECRSRSESSSRILVDADFPSLVRDDQLGAVRRDRERARLVADGDLHYDFTGPADTCVDVDQGDGVRVSVADPDAVRVRRVDGHRRYLAVLGHGGASEEDRECEGEECACRHGRGAIHGSLSNRWGGGGGVRRGPDPSQLPKRTLQVTTPGTSERASLGAFQPRNSGILGNPVGLVRQARRAVGKAFPTRVAHFRAARNPLPGEGLQRASIPPPRAWEEDGTHLAPGVAWRTIPFSVPWIAMGDRPARGDRPVVHMLVAMATASSSRASRDERPSERAGGARPSRTSAPERFAEPSGANDPSRREPTTTSSAARVGRLGRSSAPNRPSSASRRSPRARPGIAACSPETRNSGPEGPPLQPHPIACRTVRSDHVSRSLLPHRNVRRRATRIPLNRSTARAHPLPPSSSMHHVLRTRRSVDTTGRAAAPAS